MITVNLSGRSYKMQFGVCVISPDNKQLLLSFLCTKKKLNKTCLCQKQACVTVCINQSAVQYQRVLQQIYFKSQKYSLFSILVCGSMISCCLYEGSVYNLGVQQCFLLSVIRIFFKSTDGRVFRPAVMQVPQWFFRNN